MYKHYASHLDCLPQTYTFADQVFSKISSEHVVGKRSSHVFGVDLQRGEKDGQSAGKSTTRRDQLAYIHSGNNTLQDEKRILNGMSGIEHRFLVFL